MPRTMPVCQEELASDHVPLAEERSRRIHHHVDGKGQIRKTREVTFADICLLT